MALQKITVPDLEGAVDVEIVEVYISVGDSVDVEDPLISLESDKAVMDVPSPLKGVIAEIKVKEGGKVNAGDLIAMAESDESAEPEKKESASENQPDSKDSKDKKEEDIKPAQAAKEPAAPVAPPAAPSAPKAPPSPQPSAPEGNFHATPSVRSLSRELGIDLTLVRGTGPKNRITREDLTSFVKNSMAGTGSRAGSHGFGLPPIASADYAAFGETSTESLSRIKKISGPHIHRNWVGIPHVTQFDKADITDLESFRKDINKKNASAGGPKISPLIFIIKATVQTLQTFPDFNSSLSEDGASLVHKEYFNIGIAVDTPGGLLVPVIKNADKKGLFQLAEELSDLSVRTREGKLKPDEMKGATFTISSLGGIGGTYFTPIVNAPEAAILGVSKSSIQPVWNGEAFMPRLMLPFSLSYDHRVVDGAQGARFTTHLSEMLGDLRRILL